MQFSYEIIKKYSRIITLPLCVLHDWIAFVILRVFFIMAKEIWKEINHPFLINKYEISSTGKIKIKSDGRILSIRIGKRGYYSKMFKINKQIKTFTIHRLIAMTFIPNPDKKICINHINGIKTDNRIINLEWCSHKENIRHAFGMGLVKSPWLNKFGKNHVRSIPCIQYDFNMNEIARFEGQHAAARDTGICVKKINACIKGKRKFVDNFIFKYET